MNRQNKSRFPNELLPVVMKISQEHYKVAAFCVFCIVLPRLAGIIYLCNIIKEG